MLHDEAVIAFNKCHRKHCDNEFQNSLVVYDLHLLTIPQASIIPGTRRDQLNEMPLSAAEVLTPNRRPRQFHDDITVHGLVQRHRIDELSATYHGISSRLYGI